MPTVIDQLAGRVQRALAQFPELRRAIPAAELRDPRMVRAWLSAAADLDPKGAQRAAFGDLWEATDKWQGAVDLRDRISALYHDPRVIAEFGDSRDYYLRHPEEAYHALIDSTGIDGPGLAGERDRQLRHELALAFREGIDLAAEHGIETSAPPAPIPPDAGSRRDEFRALVEESLQERNGRRVPLSPEKQARLETLAGLIEGGASAEEARPAMSARPSEFDALIEESLKTGPNGLRIPLPPEKQARLETLATARAEVAGLFEQNVGAEHDE